MFLYSAFLFLLSLPFCTPSNSSSCTSYLFLYTCQARSVFSIPFVPPETRILLLPFNHISSISQNSFPWLPHLKTINLGSQISSGTFSVGESAFFNVSNVKTLDLADNRKMQLHPRAFQGLTKLEVLLLYSNGLDESVLQSDLFKDLISLRMLDLSFNQIRRLRPDPSFQKLSSLSSILLKLNKINFLCGDDLQNLHVRKLEVLDLSSNPLQFFYGTCTNPFKNISLGTLDVSSIAWNEESVKNFTNIISGTQVNYIKMKHAGALGSNFGFNNLRDPNEDTFSGLNASGINMFELSNGFISKLVPHVFSSFHQLLSLDLSSNKINKLLPGAFYGLEQLVSLNLSGNLLGEVFISSFQGLAPNALKALDLSSNHIGVIQYRALDWLVSLESLNLRDNALTKIPLVTLPKVTLILLAQNRISHTFGLSTFIPHAIILDLEGNRLTDLRSLWEILEIKSLQYLLLGKNRISKCFTVQTSKNNSDLIYLDLSDNFLGSIWNNDQCGDIFKYLGKLVFLNLARNQISSMPEELLQSMSSLQTLDLSGNKLRRLNSGLLINLTSLKTLNLGNNNLVTLSSFNLEPLHALERIDLSEVTFVCHCSLKDLWHWMENKHISVESSNIKCIQSSLPFSETPLLEYLENCA
ncbi:toll-like receptor 5 [Bombina bombina]|uniref:toll-like receptor 5 n=1 Tax=Bombina bombina TaxID=8345 RepID=UPI00235A92F6|nr:toll-like receptor 5 [Bombina bombina]